MTKTTKKKKTTKSKASKKKVAKKKISNSFDVNKPKVLVFDIETKPLIAHVWSLWENNVGLNQIEKDWSILSWSAKWLDSPPEDVMYEDLRGVKDIDDDSKILNSIWKLLDEADVVITQNGKRFDSKKLNARFILNGMKPPSPYRHIDTQEIAKRHFAFTSNKLAYMSDKLCTKYKKQTNHGKFEGHALWVECMKDNLEAWKEMEHYNKYDVLSLEELYHKLIPWDNRIDFNVYSSNLDTVCKCGSKDFAKNGFRYTNLGKYQRHVCKKCGAHSSDRVNLLSKEKKASLRVSATPPKTE